MTSDNSTQDPHDLINSIIPSTQDLSALSLPERNDLIFYLYLIKGLKQVDLSHIFNLDPGQICRIIDKCKQDQNFKSRAISVWEKDISIRMRRKASQGVDSLDFSKMPDGSKPQAIGILIDKARLIDDQSTANISYADLSKEIKDFEAEEAEILRQLGEAG